MINLVLYLIDATYVGMRLYRYAPEFYYCFDATQFSYQCAYLIHAEVFTIQMFALFELNCADGLHFSSFHCACCNIAVMCADFV